MSNDDRNRRQQQLDRLIGTLAEDTLETPDNEIIAEVVEDYGDPSVIADRMRAVIDKATLASGKAKMAQAKEAVQAYRKRAGAIGTHQMTLTQKRQLVERAIARDRSLEEKLTLAARKGEVLSERDIDGMLEDLRELGALDEEDPS
jgi:hypothetical protein